MAAQVLTIAPSVALATLMAVRGYRKRSLSASGALAAAVVGTLHMLCGLEYGALLIIFYLSSSKLTKWQSKLKSRLEADHAVGGQRGASQVLANSLGGALLAVAASTLGPGSSAGSSPGSSIDSVLAAAFLAFYACCAADTYSSEVGIVSSSPPRLITTLRRVPPGTNGGVSVLGTAAAAAGGLVMGLSFAGLRCLSSMLLGPAGSHGVNGGGSSVGGSTQHSWEWWLVALGLAAGFFGSLLDSLLGATLQCSGLDEERQQVVARRPAGAGAGGRRVRHISGYDVLSNTGVNVVSSLLTSGLAALAVHCCMAPNS